MENMYKNEQENCKMTVVQKWNKSRRSTRYIAN